MNIHRWRQLESSNPELFAKITRAQNLHKRLIQTAEEIAQREVLTAQKEKLFKELKAVLDRQPSHEVRLHPYQSSAFVSTAKQLRCYCCAALYCRLRSSCWATAIC